MELPVAFLTRAAAHHASYRTKLVLGVLSAMVSIVMLLLVGRVVALAGSGFEDRVGMTYTSFALSGTLVHGFGMSALGAFRRAVRREQLQGTLEQLILSGRSALAALVLAGWAELALQAAVYMGLAVCGVALAGVEWPPLPAVAAAGLYVLAMSGLGLASAGIIIVSKEGEPIAWAFGLLSGALGGVCFPQFLLPDWLGSAARLLPTTHALAVVRAALTGEQLPTTSLSALVLFAILSGIVGAAVLRTGLSRGRQVGTISRY